MAPHKDEADRREYQRQYRVRAAAGQSKKARSLDIPDDVRIQTAADVLDLLTWAVELVRDADGIDPIVRARCLGYLSNVALRAVEVADLEQRLAALEEANANDFAPAN